MSVQTNVLGERGKRVAEVTTDGRTFRPIVSLWNSLFDECRIEFSSDSIHTQIVDPANVAMLTLDVNPDALGGYETPNPQTIGINTSSLSGALSNARMSTRTNDDAHIAFGDMQTTVEITREYEDTTLTQSRDLHSIAPDSIREVGNAPSLEMPWSATVDVDAFVDGMDFLNGGRHASLFEDDGDLVIAATPDTNSDDDDRQFEAANTFENAAEPETSDAERGASAWYSLDYLPDIADALKSGKADDLTLRWGDEIPLILEFSRRRDDTLLYEGEFLLAPRIKDNGGAP